MITRGPCNSIFSKRMETTRQGCSEESHVDWLTGREGTIEHYTKCPGSRDRWSGEP